MFTASDGQLVFRVSPDSLQILYAVRRLELCVIFVFVFGSEKLSARLIECVTCTTKYLVCGSYVTLKCMYDIETRAQLFIALSLLLRRRLCEPQSTGACACAVTQVSPFGRSNRPLRSDSASLGVHNFDFATRSTAIKCVKYCSK